MNKFKKQTKKLLDILNKIDPVYHSTEHHYILLNNDILPLNSINFKIAVSNSFTRYYPLNLNTVIALLINKNKTTFTINYEETSVNFFIIEENNIPKFFNIPLLCTLEHFETLYIYEFLIDLYDIKDD